MNAIFLAAAMLALGMQDVETTPQTKTQLYVKTIPDGAEITLDGKVLGKSDGLYDVTSGGAPADAAAGGLRSGGAIDRREGGRNHPRRGAAEATVGQTASAGLRRQFANRRRATPTAAMPWRFNGPAR